jgi:hypothetical protein
VRRLLLLLLGLSACGDAPADAPAVVHEADAPQAVAAAVCSAEHDCACPAPAWPDRPTCVAAEVQALEDSSVIAAEHGLRYDGECVARRVQAYADAGCDRDVELEPCALACKPYVGDAERGEACERLGITVDVDTCAQGLACSAGVCMPSCEMQAPLPEGATCAAGIESLGECERTHYCASDTRQCVPRPEAGDACPDDACVDSAYCDRSDPDGPRCTARRAAGAACSVDVQCQSERCVMDECAAPAASACSFRAN